MAFNPFRAFRRHQKVLFAGLTILCMFAFVAAGSMSGPAEYLARIFGSSKAPTAIVVNGKNISTADLQQLRMMRSAANRFMAAVVSSAKEKAIDGIWKDANDWKDPQAQQTLMQIRYFERPSVVLGKNLSDNTPLTTEQRIAELEQMYDQVMRLQATAHIRNNTREVENLDNLAQIIIDDYKDIIRQRNEMYFGGKLDAQGLADFVLLRNEADRLGISINDDSLNELVRQEALDQFTTDQLRRYAYTVRSQWRGMQDDVFNSALRDEFRVRLAREALLGYNPDRPVVGASVGLAGVPLVGHQALTPFDLWKTYQDARSEARIALLAIKVDSKAFLSQVPATPKQQSELVSLYEKYKNNPEDPDSPTPGFMVPDRYAFEWVSARKDAPYFRNKAEAQLRSRLAAIVATAYQGLTPILADTDVVSWFSKLDAAKANPDVDHLWDDSSFFDDIRRVGTPKTLNAVDAAQAVAAAMGNATTSVAAPLASAAAYESTLAVAQAERAIIPAFDASAIGLALVPRGGLLTAAAWLHYADTNKRYLPEGVAVARVYQEMRDDLATRLVQQTMQDLRDQLDSRSGLSTASAGQDFRRLYQPSKGHVPFVAQIALATAGAAGSPSPLPAASFVIPAAQQAPATLAEQQRLAATLLAAGNHPLGLVSALSGEFSSATAVMREPIDRAVKVYGLDHARMTKPVSRFDLAQSKPLAKLKEAKLSFSTSLTDPASRDAQFTDDLVGKASNPRPEGALYQPQSAVAQDGEEFLYWKSGFVDRRTPTFAEAKDRALAWWKLDKARKLAEDEAKRIATEVAKHKGNGAAALRELQAAGHKPVITLDHVARLVRSTQAPPAMASMSSPYRPYEVPLNTGVKPSPQFVKNLLTLKQPGETIVVHDAPETTYYVAVLEQRDPPREQQFITDYASPATRGMIVSVADQPVQAEQSNVLALLETLRQRAGLRITDEGVQSFKSVRD